MAKLIDTFSDLYKRRLAKEINLAIAKGHTIRYGWDNVMDAKFSQGGLVVKVVDVAGYVPATDLDEFYDVNLRETICASREAK